MLNLTRQQLSQFLPNQAAITVFEQIINFVNSSNPEQLTNLANQLIILNEDVLTINNSITSINNQLSSLNTLSTEVSDLILRIDNRRT